MHVGRVNAVLLHYWFCVFDILFVRFAGGILIPRALSYGLCMEHVGWLPPASGKEFIRFVEIDDIYIDIYTPVRVNDDETITELLRDYDLYELARVRTAVDEQWGGCGDHQLPISKHAQTLKQVRNSSVISINLITDDRSTTSALKRSWQVGLRARRLRHRRPCVAESEHRSRALRLSTDG